MAALSTHRLAVCVFLFVLGALSARGESPGTTLEKFSLHGYLNQAYAVSEEYPIHGIPTDGTTELRDLALQFRFDATARDGLAVQVRHQAFGESNRETDDVELGWAFYQRKFSDAATVKAGRIPLPLRHLQRSGWSGHHLAVLPSRAKLGSV
jgi:hypothetical protein